MRNALIVVGVIFGGTALFLGSTFGVLAFQGKLEGDSLRSLKKTPIMGSLLPSLGLRRRRSRKAPSTPAPPPSRRRITPKAAKYRGT